MLGLSLHGWENAMVVFLIIAGAFALVAGAATWAVVRLQRTELANSEHELERFKLETSKNISEANAALGAAQVDIAKAQATAATANLEAARLRLELDREIQKRAQRVLTDEQKEAFETLKGQIAEIAVVTQNDPEAVAFAHQILGALSGIKIYVPEPPREDKWFAPAGLIMYSPLGADDAALQRDPLYTALKRANLFGGTMGGPFTSGQPRVPALERIPGYNGYVLYVGQKSPF